MEELKELCRKLGFIVSFPSWFRMYIDATFTCEACGHTFRRTGYNFRRNPTCPACLRQEKKQLLMEKYEQKLEEHGLECLSKSFTGDCRQVVILRSKEDGKVRQTRIQDVFPQDHNPFKVKRWTPEHAHKHFEFILTMTECFSVDKTWKGWDYKYLLRCKICEREFYIHGKAIARLPRLKKKWLCSKACWNEYKK